MYVHGNNLTRKERKHHDPVTKTYLEEIRDQYDRWKEENEKLKGPFKESSEEDDETLKRRVLLFSDYKNFIDQKKYAEYKKLDSRSNLHSSVIEEFMYYLFRDLVIGFSDSALIGKSHAFKDIFFRPENYENFVSWPNANIETKDHDFAIGTKIRTKMNTAGSESVQEATLEVPAVAIECKDVPR